MVAGEKSDPTVLDVVRDPHLQAADVVSKQEISVELCDQKSLGCIRHEDVLIALARLKMLHVVIVHVRLYPGLAVPMETVTADLTSKHYRTTG